MPKGESAPLRKLVSLNEAWACSECAWVFKSFGPPQGDSLDEMKSNSLRQRDKTFANHLCAEHPKKHEEEELRSKMNDLRNEAARLEIEIMAASASFDSLTRLLKNCQVVNVDWSIYEKLIADLPSQSTRFEELKLEFSRLQGQLDELAN